MGVRWSAGVCLAPRQTYVATVRVLVVTSEWATRERPEGGVFIAQQVDWIQRTGIAVDVEPFRSARNPLNYVAVRRRVRSRLRSGGYDLIHAHFGQAGLAMLGLKAPLVVTFHGSDLLGIVGRRGTYTMRGRLLRRLSRFVARRAGEVIVVSQVLAQHLPAGVGYSVIPMTANPEVFRPGPRDDARRHLGLPLDRKLVLFAGRPEVATKRYALAKAVVDLVAREHRAELLTISGLPPSGVAMYMQACDALLVTSKHESGPVVVKEALACRLPVVSVDVGDVRETVAGVGGCRVTQSDTAEELGRALDQVLSEGSRLDGSDRAEVLDQAKLAAKVVTIYERLVGSRASPARDVR